MVNKKIKQDIINLIFPFQWRCSRFDIFNKLSGLWHYDDIHEAFEQLKHELTIGIDEDIVYLKNLPKPEIKQDTGYIRTYTGKKFYLLNPRIEDISFDDISHSLSRICRFTGATKFFYPVSQHCYYASYYVEKGYELEALLHDGTETWVTDLNNPLKTLLLEYKKIEDNIAKVVAQKFNLPFPHNKQIKEIDTILYNIEVKQLMNGGDLEYDKELIREAYCNNKFNNIRTLKITPWTPEIAEENFRNRYFELTAQK